MADKPKISIPWWEPQIGTAERDLVLDVLSSNYVNDGQVTTRFEDQVASLLGCRHAVGVTNCTSALSLSLVALGIGPGDEVVVPDVTFIATVNAVSMTGARPILVDVDGATLTMSPAAFAAAVTPRTRAVIPVHVSGRAADMGEILRIAGNHGIAVVEDAAEAFMSSLNGRFLGTFGRLGCLSFSPMKLITTGQGGMVVTDDDALHLRLRQLKDQGRPVRGTGGDDMHPVVGYNFKLTNIQAAVGVGQLKTIQWRMERVRETYGIYRDRLDGLNGVTLLPFRIEAGELPMWVDVIVEDRDRLVDFLRENGVDCRPYWHPVHAQRSYRSSDAGFPNSTSLLPRALWLPSALSLSNEDVVRVCDLIRQHLEP